jgi:rhombotail lipoprotein
VSVTDARTIAASMISAATLKDVVLQRPAPILSGMKSSRAGVLSALFLSICTGLLLGSGCVSRRFQKADRSTSVVSYLYPQQSIPVTPAGIPLLRLPLRVGVAFVPSSPGNGNQVYNATPPVTELQKSALLERVAAEFSGLEYIQNIQIIPSSYLRPGGGFENLNQVRTLFGVDVIALVAYDQIQFTNQNVFSLTYLTIVGAYLVHGNQNDTQTLMEAAVYDVESRRLLFRAPGGSQVKAGAAAAYLPQRLRADSAKGFDEATTELIVNLKTQLEGFRARVKASPGEVKIEHKPGYTGSGSLGGIFAGAVGALGFARFLLRRRSF